MTEHKTDDHLGKEHDDKLKQHELGRQHPAAGHETNARADDKKTAREGEQVTGMAADQVTTEPSSPPHLGGKMVAAILGPMRGHVLIMPEAEADQAINDHWAVEQTSTHDQDKDDQHPPLDDAEREAAEAAAKAWSDKAHGIEPPPTEPPPEVEPPPEDGQGLRRTVPDRGMRPDPGGSYQTRAGVVPPNFGTPHPAPKPEPPKPQPKPDPKPEPKPR